MSTRLTGTFEALKAEGRKALVGYLTAGDPDYDTSLAILESACRSGLDVLELGVPFSDPTSDGPVIQAAALRALKAGMTVKRALAMTAELRRRVQTPIILFSYYNPLLHYGLDQLGKDAAAAGADGFLVVDLPPEESEEFTGKIGVNLPLIRLVAPTTPAERMRLIVNGAGGFLYAITRTGVTGTGTLDPLAIGEEMKSIRAASGKLPVCLGFGIRTPADAKALAPLADGVVVGSALVKMVEDPENRKNLPKRIGDYIRALKQAI